MANTSKGERRLIGIRLPVEMVQAAKEEAQRQGLGINDYYVNLIRRGLKLERELAHAPSRTSPRIV